MQPPDALANGLEVVLQRVGFDPPAPFIVTLHATDAGDWYWSAVGMDPFLPFHPPPRPRGMTGVYAVNAHCKEVAAWLAKQPTLDQHRFLSAPAAWAFLERRCAEGGRLEIVGGANRPEQEPMSRAELLSKLDHAQRRVRGLEDELDRRPAPRPKGLRSAAARARVADRVAAMTDEEHAAYVAGKLANFGDKLGKHGPLSRSGIPQVA